MGAEGRQARDLGRTARARCTGLRSIALACCLAACGGSGSTGLILPESAYLEAVRRDGNCLTVEALTYCATDSADAITRGGQSADGPVEAGAMPCPNGDATCPGQDQLGFSVSGFSSGAACAAATRRAGSSDPWTLGPLVPVGVSASVVPLTFPAELSPVDAEAALLCFSVPPAALPAQVAELADGGPDIVFVPRDG